MGDIWLAGEILDFLLLVELAGQLTWQQKNE